MAVGLDAASAQRVRSTAIVLQDLPDSILAASFTNTTLLDPTAASFGRFVDVTPWDDSEFSLTGTDDRRRAHTPEASGRMDLLTVLAHELGHLLGVNHDEDGIMSPTLAPGMRRRPSPAEIDELFSSNPDVSLLLE